MAKNIAILGSTGSIGVNALRVIESLGGDFTISAITAHNNIELLAAQARQFKPKYIGLTNPDKYSEFKELYTPPVGVEVLVGGEAMSEIAANSEIDLVLAAVVGAAGLGAVLAAAKTGKTIAIANKEPLVIAGQLLTETARENDATILPVDSEHCAIFQCLQAGQLEEVSKIILTASGGPFRNASTQEIAQATIDDALAHPTWNMGPKISIDSATMMNKALEVIEAHWLFDISVDDIDVLVHPESIVHSLVEFVDGSVIAQMGSPDMCHPIQYALTYPKRLKGITKHLKLDELGVLTFEKPNVEVFRSLKLCFEVARVGGSAPVVFNAANEAAVELFLAGRIKFHHIVELIDDCLSKHNVKAKLSLDELLVIDKWARTQTNEMSV